MRRRRSSLVLLKYLLEAAFAKRFRDQPVTVVVDECQNLSFKQSGTVCEILNEGRKFHLGLMLAAPSVSACGKDAEKVIPQCAFRACFKPLETDYKMLCRYIPNNNKKAIPLMLSGLRTGEFIPVLTYKAASETKRLQVLKTYIPAGIDCSTDDSTANPAEFQLDGDR